MPSRFFKFGILAFAASAFAFAFAFAFSAFAIFFKMFASVYGSVCGIDGSLFSGSVFARLAPLASFSIQLGIYLSLIPSLRARFFVALFGYLTLEMLLLMLRLVFLSLPDAHPSGLD